MIFTALHESLNRLKQGIETHEDMKFLSEHSEQEIKDALIDLGDVSTAAQGKWNPDNGDKRDGRFYGRN
jgi:hypothetical protein